jgi:hypothetical protein
MEGVTLNDLTARVAADAATDDCLDQLDAALAVATLLERQADALVDHFVSAARGQRRSWTEIGERLGVSKQAARKRFAAAAGPSPVLPPGVRLDRRVQGCLADAGRAAQRAGATEIGTEHLLAGLLTEGVAASILDRLSVTAETIGTSAERLFGPPRPAGPAPPPLSDEAVCAIEAAAHHALARGRDQDAVAVGTEHVLGALVLDPGSRAGRVLADVGADIAAVKKELACYVGSPRRTRRFGRRRARQPSCSFCGTGEGPARPLVQGPAVTICGTCAQRALERLNVTATA